MRLVGPHRRLVAVLAAACVLVALALVGSLLLGGGDDSSTTGAPREPPRVTDPLAAALAHADPAAALVAVVPTAEGSPGKRGLDAVTSRLPPADLARREVQARLQAALGLDWREALRAQAGAPLVAWAPDAAHLTRIAAALVVADPVRLRPELEEARRAGRLRGLAVALRGRVLLLATSRGELDAAVARADARAGLTRADLAQRALGLGDGAAALVLADASELTRARLGTTEVDRVPWLAALGRGAAEVRLGATGVDVTARAQLDAALQPADLPLARGAATPRARGLGLGPVVAGIREPAQALRTLEATLPALGPRGTSAAAGLDAVRRQASKLLGLDVDGELVDRLGGTLSLVGGRALDVLVARGELTDPGGVDDALGRARALARVSGLAGLAGVDTGGYDLDTSDDRVRLAREDRALGVAALRDDDVLVLSDDARADVDRAAEGRPLPVPTGARGAALAVADAPRLVTALAPRLGLPAIAASLLGPVGDPWASAEAETTDDGSHALTLRARIPIEG